MNEQRLQFVDQFTYLQVTEVLYRRIYSWVVVTRFQPTRWWKIHQLTVKSSFILLVGFNAAELVFVISRNALMKILFSSLNIKTKYIVLYIYILCHNNNITTNPANVWVSILFYFVSSFDDALTIYSYLKRGNSHKKQMRCLMVCLP